jgi:D-alanyl-D-alanine carboxypeptidase
MQTKLFLSIAVLMLPIANCHAKTFDEKANDVLASHYTAYKDKEYFSGIALSVYKPKQPIKNYYIGKTSHDSKSANIDSQTLFNIGSITKSFTAAILLQLEKENKLKMTDTLDHWLPDYAKWGKVTIHHMLDMTSGLPNYSDSPLMNAEEFKDMQRQWTKDELIAFVYPPKDFSPPLRGGYNYTNTGYVLCDFIIEKATQHSLKEEMQNRLFHVAKLENTFYPIPAASASLNARLASGYGFNPYSNPEIVGRDMKLTSLTWAGAAGAIVSNATDVVKWTQALFVEDKILDKEQKRKLMQLVSTANGQPITATSEKNPRGFGLGVSQGYDKKMGQFWFYEGQTEGYRALFMYVPSTGIIVAAIFNSAVNGENDHASELVSKVYEITKQ